MLNIHHSFHLRVKKKISGKDLHGMHIATGVSAEVRHWAAYSSISLSGSQHAERRAEKQHMSRACACHKLGQHWQWTCKSKVLGFLLRTSSVSFYIWFTSSKQFPKLCSSNTPQEVHKALTTATRQIHISVLWERASGTVEQSGFTCYNVFDSTILPFIHMPIILDLPPPELCN